jgi:hypothetical protein
VNAAPVLHLVDPSGPGASRWLCELARLQPGRSVVALGSGSIRGTIARIPVPAGSAALAARALERLSEQVRAEGIVAWGARAAEVAVRARDSAERLLVLDDAPSGGPVAFDANVLAVGDAPADRACAAGWPPMRIRVAPPPTPWIAEPDAGAIRRRAWRRERGIPDATFVVGLLPAAPGSGDAWSALHAVGRVRMAGVDAALVLDPGTAEAASTQVFARSIGMRYAMRFEPLQAGLADVAPAIDAWISLPGKGPDGTALDPAVAAGTLVPLVVAQGSLAGHAVERGVDALVAEPPNGLASALLDLLEQPQRRQAIASAARVRHAAAPVREVFVKAIQDFEARASMRAASALAASK